MLSEHMVQTNSSHTVKLVVVVSEDNFPNILIIYFKILTNKPTGKRLLGRPKRKWEDNIRTDLK